MKTPRVIRRGRGGFTMIELVVGLGLISVFLLGTGSYFNFASQDRVRERDASTRDDLVYALTSSAMIPTTLRNSYLNTSNHPLSDCLNSNAVFVTLPPLPPVPPDPAKQDCASGQTYDLVLLDAIFVGGSSGAHTGTQSAPLLYHSDGTPCPPPIAAGDYCPIQAWTTFTPQCPPAVPLGPPVPNCDVAELINITLHIEPSGAVPPAGKVPVTFKAIVENVAVPVQNITGSTPDISPRPVPLPSPGTVVPPTIPPVNTFSVKCPGETHAFGPNFCACATGLTLTDPYAGICRLVGY